MTDALTDILRSIQMRGSIFSRASLDAPWGIESGRTTSGIFHAVVRGRAWVRLADGGHAVELQRGDVVVMPDGDNHVMADAPDRDTVPIRDATTLDDRGMGHLVVDGGGVHTSLICGTVDFDRSGVHPVFSVVPPLIVVRDQRGRMSRVVEMLVELIAEEVDEPIPGSEAVVARLTDVLLVYVLRRYIADLPDDHVGWLGALRDPAIAEALGLIHRYPARSWTAAELAAAVGMSRSSFFSRFRTTVGESPGEYLTRWRIHVASRLLRDERGSVAAVAKRVGYGTEAAFSNAFLRVVGVRPGAYKRAS